MAATRGWVWHTSRFSLPSSSVDFNSRRKSASFEEDRQESCVVIKTKKEDLIKMRVSLLQHELNWWHQQIPCSFGLAIGPRLGREAPTERGHKGLQDAFKSLEPGRKGSSSYDPSLYIYRGKKKIGLCMYTLCTHGPASHRTPTLCASGQRVCWRVDRPFEH